MISSRTLFFVVSGYTNGGLPVQVRVFHRRWNKKNKQTTYFPAITSHVRNLHSELVGIARRIFRIGTTTTNQDATEQNAAW